MKRILCALFALVLVVLAGCAITPDEKVVCPGTGGEDSTFRWHMSCGQPGIADLSEPRVLARSCSAGC